jgi:hypothetical protein
MVYCDTSLNTLFSQLYLFVRLFPRMCGALSCEAGHLSPIYHPRRVLRRVHRIAAEWRFGIMREKIYKYTQRTHAAAANGRLHYLSTQKETILGSRACCCSLAPAR